jgi:Na+/H+ antiporter NhaA
VIALAWANSPWSAGYERLWSTNVVVGFGDSRLSLDLRELINDGQMRFFFFVVGLEIGASSTWASSASGAASRRLSRRRSAA